jgi:hypothetical protein
MPKRTYFFLLLLLCSWQNSRADDAQPTAPREIDRGYVCDEARKNLSKKRRILKSAVIKAVDSFINSTLFNKILVLRQHLSNMLFGMLTKDGTRIGIYTIADTKYSIQQLAQLERDQGPEALNAILLQAKTDFEHQTTEFLGLAKSFKSQMLILIDESLRLHKRTESILLTWAEAKDGQEMLSFEKNVTSFDGFARFLHDLLNYLDDLIASCPKAQKVFLQTKNDQEQRIYAQRFKGIYERQKHKIDNYK